VAAHRQAGAGFLLHRRQRHNGATLGESTVDSCERGLRQIWREEGACVVCVSRERGGGTMGEGSRDTWWPRSLMVGARLPWMEGGGRGAAGGRFAADRGERVSGTIWGR
jgi:hypothetical protein